MGLLSNTPVHHAVPDESVLPPEKRPEPDELVDPTVTLPVVDLAAGRRRHLVVNEITKAGKEFGFFQARTHAPQQLFVYRSCHSAIDFGLGTVLHRCVANRL